MLPSVINLSMSSALYTTYPGRSLIYTPTSGLSFTWDDETQLNHRRLYTQMPEIHKMTKDFVKDLESYCSPPVSDSGLCPTNSAPPHCKSPNMKQLPKTWRSYIEDIKHKVARLYNQNPTTTNEMITDLLSPSALAMWPKICAKEFGIIPRSSGTALTPSMVKVLPVPVCPYAKMVPEMDNNKQIIIKVNCGKQQFKLMDNWCQQFHHYIPPTLIRWWGGQWDCRRPVVCCLVQTQYQM